MTTEIHSYKWSWNYKETRIIVLWTDYTWSEFKFVPRDDLDHGVSNSNIKKYFSELRHFSKRHVSKEDTVKYINEKIKEIC